MSSNGARKAVQAVPQSHDAHAPERQHRRYAHEAAIRISAGAVKTTGRTRNVSHGGLCATVDQAFTVGADVTVDMTLVFDQKTQSDALTLSARVAWCTTVDNKFQVGLSFKALTADRIEMLQLFLKCLGEERAPVQRRPRAASIDDQFD